MKNTRQCTRRTLYRIGAPAPPRSRHHSDPPPMPIRQTTAGNVHSLARHASARSRQRPKSCAISEGRPRFARRFGLTKASNAHRARRARPSGGNLRRLEEHRYRCIARSSTPLRGWMPVPGGFDSHAFPPIILHHAPHMIALKAHSFQGGPARFCARR